MFHGYRKCRKRFFHPLRLPEVPTTAEQSDVASLNGVVNVSSSSSRAACFARARVSPVIGRTLGRYQPKVVEPVVEHGPADGTEIPRMRNTHQHNSQRTPPKEADVLPFSHGLPSPSVEKCCNPTWVASLIEKTGNRLARGPASPGTVFVRCAVDGGEESTLRAPCFLCAR